MNYKPKIGAHVSAAGSLSLSFERAQEIGAECTQIFISPPQQWAQIEHSSKEIEKYLQETKKTRIEPNFVHATYLINLASQNPEHLQKSINWLIHAQKEAERLKVIGTIFHIGSAGKMERGEALNQVIKAVSEILQNTGQINLILETSAGAGNTIGDEFFELGQIIKKVGDNRLKVCLDTQHTFASGYDVRSKEGLDQTLEEFEGQVGLKNLVVIHANDSKTELGSRKDRHENIGDGLIGLDGFRNIINHQSLKDIPFILEVPGEGSGPDTNNILRLKGLIIK